ACCGSRTTWSRSAARVCGWGATTRGGVGAAPGTTHGRTKRGTGQAQHHNAPDKMVHWHGENPNDPRTGLSKLESLRDVVAEDAALQQATVELANSGLTEPAWGVPASERPTRGH